MAWGPWISLQYDDEEMVDHASPVMPEKPEFPYGCRLSLSGRELEMAQLPLPKRGDLIDMRILAEVTNVSDGEGGQRVELQIQMMKLENEDEDEDEDGAGHLDNKGAFPEQDVDYDGGH